jgi:hypothetical protein
MTGINPDEQWCRVLIWKMEQIMMSGTADPKSVTPVAGGPLDPQKAFQFPKAETMKAEPAKRETGHSLTTVNNDFAIKPVPKTFETD